MNEGTDATIDNSGSGLASAAVVSPDEHAHDDIDLDNPEFNPITSTGRAIVSSRETEYDEPPTPPPSTSVSGIHISRPTGIPPEQNSSRVLNDIHD